MAGERIWQRDLRIRLWIGPLSRSAFADFLPGGARAQALEKLLTMFGGLSFEYEVRLVMAKEDVAGSALGGDAEGGGARLGWNSSAPNRRRRTATTPATNCTPSTKNKTTENMATP